MAHRPIAIDGAIDGARADGSAEGAGGVEPGPSNDHGGDGACIDQVSGCSDGLSSPERPRQICGSPPYSERAPAFQAPQIAAQGVKTYYGEREGVASQHRHMPHLRGERRRRQRREYEFRSSHSIFPMCFIFLLWQYAFPSGSVATHNIRSICTRAPHGYRLRMKAMPSVRCRRCQVLQDEGNAEKTQKS